MFGPHHTPLLGHIRPWHLLFKLPAKGTDYIFLGLSSSSGENDIVDRMAYSPSQAARIEQRQHHGPQTTHSAPPQWIEYSWAYYTSAELSGVIEIIPCQLRHAGYSSIIGLLLRYSDGSRSCVGQCRLDCLSSPLAVDAPSPSLYLAFDRRRGHFHHLARIEIYPPKNRASLEWLDLPWHGLLEWWIGPRQVKIHHLHQESPCQLG